MTAIETYFIAPTNTRGSRYKAVALGTSHSVTVEAEYRLGSSANHERVARMLINKLGWTYGQWYSGDAKHGAYMFVCALECAKLTLTDELERVS